MKIHNKDIYICPACFAKFNLTVTKQLSDSVIEGALKCRQGHVFPIKKGIADLTWPKELAEIDKQTREVYEKLAANYDKIASFPFDTFKSKEDDIRERITNQLAIRADSIVLEVGGGDGRGAKHIVSRLGKKGKLFFQELSPAFLAKAITRLNKYTEKIDFSIGNASCLSFSDNYFDAAHHFGGVSTFSDVKGFLKELTRVVKPGGRIVIGDESMAPWLVDTEFGKIMSNSNPLFKYQIPFKDIPVEARDVKIEWIMMGAFFILEFTVGKGEPQANYHIPIPTERGGTHWSRYYGNLEGISDETKALAYKAQKKSGKSMHDWLNDVVRNAIKKELK